MVTAFSIVLGCSIAAAGDDDLQPAATLDFGQVWQGSVLEPCVYIKNTSSTSTTIKHVRPTCTPGKPINNIVLGPLEETIQPLPQVNTRDFYGPISKSYLLLLDPPVSLEVALLESCEGK
jgi:hypothetical protein